MSRLRVRLGFSPEKVTEPVIYQLGHRFQIVTNIRQAGVTRESGWVVLELTGEADELERGVEWLRGEGVDVAAADGDSAAG